MESAFIVRNWGSILAKGIMALAFGVILLVWPTATIKVLIYTFGIFALLVGILWGIAFCVEVSRKEKWGASLTIALIGIFVGILCLARPNAAAVTVLYLIVVYLLASGAIEMAVAVALPKEAKHKWLLAFEGIAAIIVGFLLMLIPGSTVRAIVIVLGVYSIVAGIIDIAVSFMVRKFFNESGADELLIEG